MTGKALDSSFARTPMDGARPTPAVTRDDAADARTIEDIRQANATRPILIRGGAVVTVDSQLGAFLGDVLIREGKIAEVAPDLSAATREDGCIVVDARDTIVMPGLIDSHVHAWEGQLRGAAPAIDLDTYAGLTHNLLARHYRPHDMYVGNLITALQALDAGVTTIIDNSHNARSAAHSDAAVEALMDSGIRAVHASGAAAHGTTDTGWSQDLLRLRDEYFSSDSQLVTLRVMDAIPDPTLWQFAKDNELWMTHEMGPWITNLGDMDAAGLLTERHAFNHCFGIPDTDFALIADAGAQVNVVPRSDATFGLGPSCPPVDEALAHGIRPGISMDNEISYGIDMFIEMQTLLNAHRARTFQAQRAGQAATHLSVADIVEFATLGGAANAGLTHAVGSLTPGKDADLILINTSDFNTAPTNNVWATLVGLAHRGNVDTVLVAGRVRKWRGHLVDVDLSAVRAAADASRDYLLDATGLQRDIFASCGFVPV